MLLYTPKLFDENEWFIIIAILANILIFLTIPKKLPKDITVLIVLLSMSYPKVMDHSLAVEPLDFYNVTDTKKYELFDFLLYGAYPAFGYLFVYFIDAFHLRKYKLVLYIVGWSIFAVLFEWICVQFHVFVYTGWKLIYSLPIYIIVEFITYLFFQLTMRYRRKLPHVD